MQAPGLHSRRKTIPLVASATSSTLTLTLTLIPILTLTLRLPSLFNDKQEEERIFTHSLYGRRGLKKLVRAEESRPVDIILIFFFAASPEPVRAEERKFAIKMGTNSENAL